MATFEPGSRAQAAHPPQPSPTPAAAIWRAIAVASRRLAQHRAQALRNQRDVQALSQLDDHQLKDIGLMRSQIESLVADRPTRGAATRPPASTHRVCDAQA